MDDELMMDSIHTLGFWVETFQREISQSQTNKKVDIIFPRSKGKMSHQMCMTSNIPSMGEIMEASRAQNLHLQLQTVGPLFRITASTSTSTSTKEGGGGEGLKEIGRAEGLIRLWFDHGKILHLDSIRLKRDTLSMERSIFGIGLFIGAVAIRHGFDCGCNTAQLLAINDSPLYHSKLVRFYTRIGFKAVHQVTGSSIGDLPHMLVWGGKGTRMDASVEQLMVKWRILGHEVHCSRERSKAAWKIIDEYLMPSVEKEKYQISKACRIHPDNDMFRDQENHKIHVDINEWQCGHCKKRFYAEKYLDNHFDNRHYNLLNVNDSMCLADLCGALHCGLVMDFPPPKTKCNPAATLKNRHLCEKVASKCFPVSGGPSASRLHEFFLRQFCDAHTCSGGKKPFPKGGKKRTSILYIIASIFTLMLLPLIYGFVYLYQKGLRRGTQDLRRISQTGRKKKPS